jgi:hypothetical protein
LVSLASHTATYDSDEGLPSPVRTPSPVKEGAYEDVIRFRDVRSDSIERLVDYSSSPVRGCVPERVGYWPLPKEGLGTGDKARDADDDGDATAGVDDEALRATNTVRMQTANEQLFGKLDELREAACEHAAVGVPVIGDGSTGRPRSVFSLSRGITALPVRRMSQVYYPRKMQREENGVQGDAGKGEKAVGKEEKKGFKRKWKKWFGKGAVDDKDEAVRNEWVDEKQQAEDMQHEDDTDDDNDEEIDFFEALRTTTPKPKTQSQAQARQGSRKGASAQNSATRKAGVGGPRAGRAATAAAGPTPRRGESMPLRGGSVRRLEARDAGVGTLRRTLGSAEMDALVEHGKVEEGTVESEVARLRKEIELLREENEALKKERM